MRIQCAWSRTALATNAHLMHIGYSVISASLKGPLDH